MEWGRKVRDLRGVEVCGGRAGHVGVTEGRRKKLFFHALNLFFLTIHGRFAIAFGVIVYTLTVAAAVVLNLYRNVPFVKVRTTCRFIWN